MKKIISMFLLLATVATASAQRFEWAEGYNSAQENLNSITGAVVDSSGNLYIMGFIRHNAEWDGECIFPEFYSPWPFSDINTIIAKISPEGEMLWRKFVFCFNGGGSRPCDIKLVGDTAVVCLFDFMHSAPVAGLYYLDTLVTGRSDYPCNGSKFQNLQVVAYVSFDFDGNVTEEHFLRLSPVDNDGNDFYFYDIMPNDTIAYIRNMFMYGFRFCIDDEGTIYIYRQASDYLEESLNAWSGAFSAIKVWDDARLVGTFPVEGRRWEWEQQILKFAPHFDTLLASRYVIQKSDSIVVDNLYPSLQIDNNSNLYTILTLQKGNRALSSLIVVDSIQNFSINQQGYNSKKGYMIKYDSDLNVKWVVDFEDSVISTNDQWYSNSFFHDIALDEDSNLLFLAASSGRAPFGDTTNYFSVLMYQGIPFKLKNDAFVVAFNNTDTQPTIHSYCRIPAVVESGNSPGTLYSEGNLVCKNNRIFMQANFLGGLRYNGINYPSDNYWDINCGLFVFDYDGHVITHNSYNIDIRGDDRNGPLALKDSILYIMMDIRSHATFGDTTVYSWGQLACIAKYVDTSFMTPYVHPVPDVGVRPATDMPRVTLYPNPVTNQLSISSEKPVAPQAYIINSVGIRMPATVQDNRIDVSRLKPGIYFLELYIDNQLSTTKFIKL